MAHIALPEGLPGILGPMAFRPETAVHLNGLAETLLRGPSPLSRGERELIASYVSRLNDCVFCCSSHSAFAAFQLDGGYDVEIHDAVLIAAAFCMFNRYVDGLGTYAPPARADYDEMGRMIVEHGYLASTPTAAPADA